MRKRASVLERLLRGREADALRQRAARTAPRAARARAPGARRACCRRRAWISSTITVLTDFSMARPESDVEQDVERLRRRDQDVRRRAAHRARAPSAACRRCAPRRGSAGRGRQLRGQLASMPAQRLLQVLLDVVRERLQRRDVENLRLVARGPPAGLAHQLVDAARNAASVLPEPVGARSACRRCERDRAQAWSLHLGRRGRSAAEPGGDGRVEVRGEHAPSIRKGVFMSSTRRLCRLQLKFRAQRPSARQWTRSLASFRPRSAASNRA